MTERVMFDTLRYARMLTDSFLLDRDTTDAGVFAEALAVALEQNLYAKCEVDKMIEAALRRFDERTHQMSLDSQKEIQRLDERTHQLELKIGHQFSKTITVLGSLIVFVGAITSFVAHH